MSHSYRLILGCPDRVGIVAAVSRFIAERDGWIVEADQYSDPASHHFFMRVVIRAESLNCPLDQFRRDFVEVAARYEMNWRLHDSAQRQRVAILASRESHCLYDLLHRWKDGELLFDLPCVIGNHDHLAEAVEWHGVPFYHVPMEPARKQAGFDRIHLLLQQHRVDVVVLARFMQILPNVLCQHYAGQIINIHHSFLPSFIGAKPYHQAAERGVKLVGATCHYVTEALDAGPIIEQDVVRVSHHDTIEDMIRLGRDVEKQVLARGLRYHLEDRALIHGNKTVIFA
ncbi:MAG: formyltetrahydrofolate deformylase [Pseudomonadales bacterium]|jgi:formyltetrahydrofolate deformylase|nr:formyltetrahydrofolate deformylase [Pseudomonadales bacterium]HMU89163.1 formyltetrahydrofolate deformylase [Pseudomonadales bacterium]HMW82469.1 formyltetrahydrofolate deformylase [Pseudomonadales bacterium]HMZ71324.1 formyltetrahydrofolate deformylase [Pseudomonadales bacterium]HMZ92691.1 formyltetrahydrofolate deformylase [Pseudomonadales bacterium]